MLTFNIKGLECYYSRYSGDEAAFLKTTADKHDLLISGGSDYHGSNKNISLGELSCDGSVVYANSLTVLQKL